MVLDLCNKWSNEVRLNIKQTLKFWIRHKLEESCKKAVERGISPKCRS